MGRIRKAKIDMIIKLRKEGYTQAEVAEKVGVHLKTVQRYDPMRQDNKAKGTASLTQAFIENLQDQIKTLGDWIAAIQVTLMEVQHIPDLRCPVCYDGKLVDDENRPGMFYCTLEDCEYEMRLPSHVWER